MANPEIYPFITVNSELGEAGFRPYFPLKLTYQKRSLQTYALLDTGAMVNVLPYPVGIELGYVWEQQTTALSLTGNLAQYEARAVVINTIVGKFEPVQLVFAWTKATNVPLLLGQVNFFMEFDVCFHRSQLYFEINPKQKVVE
ncbi:hypothetical protein MEO94_32430 [Dolichospermum sp. ST_sed9]|nr:hypothetical protein [Dolichospermum sp. ST_sed9]